MLNKMEALSLILRNKRYDDLSREDYMVAGFSGIEVDTLQEIYYSLILHSRNSKTDECISFIDLALEKTENVHLRYYFNVYRIMYDESKRYECAKTCVDLVLDEHELLFNIMDTRLCEIDTLNEVLKYSTMMNIDTKKVLEVVLWYVDSTKELISFTKTIELALNKIGDDKLKAEFIRIYKERISISVNINDAHSLDNFLGKIEDEKNAFFKPSYIKDVVYDAYYEIGIRDTGIRATTSLQKAAAGFRKIGRLESERKVLAKLEEHLKSDEIDWHVSHYEYERSPIELQQYKYFEKYLEETTLKKILIDSDKLISINVCGVRNNIYHPFPSKREVDSLNKESVSDMIFSQMVVSGNRIVSSEKYNKFASDLHEYHFVRNVNPMMKWLERFNVMFIKELKDYYYESDFLSEETKKYFDRVIGYYKKEMAFEFIHFGVILIEKVIRDIYFHITGTTLSTMKTDNSAQFIINFQEIMKQQEMKDYLSESFYSYLQFSLNEDSGLNLRNNVAHGLINVDEFNHGYSRVILHILIMLIAHKSSEELIPDIGNWKV